MPYGLYVHIPYCHRRCLYCNFYTAAQNGGVPEDYIDALLNSFSRLALRNAKVLRRPQTLYFGGGTPSLLSPAQVKRIIKHTNPLPNSEITLEANPESVNLENLQGFFRAGVNRLSLGVQTANPKSLKTLGRLHTATQAAHALNCARKAGFKNITGDIMLGLPNYTTGEFDETFKLLQNGGVSHISCYLLKIEPDTAFGKKVPAGLPSADEAADFYLYAASKLTEQGFAQYEISNFAKPGFESKHNLLYWNCENYLGIGPAAHSCIDNKRFAFKANLNEFLQGVPPLPDGVCTAEDYIMLRLRLNKGLNKRHLKSRFNFVLSDEQETFLHKLASAKLAICLKDTWALTPEGMLLQNSILAQLI